MGIKLRAVLAAFGMAAAVTAMSVQAQTKPTIKLIYTDPVSYTHLAAASRSAQAWPRTIV